MRTPCVIWLEQEGFFSSDHCKIIKKNIDDRKQHSQQDHNRIKGIKKENAQSDGKLSVCYTFITNVQIASKAKWKKKEEEEGEEKEREGNRNGINTSITLLY